MRMLGTQRVLLSVGPGEVRRAEFEVPLARRGTFSVGNVTFRVLGLTGARWLGFKEIAGETCVVYPRIWPLHFSARLPGKPRPYGGNSVSHLRGEGVDLAEVREYRAGDETRQINWLVSARKGRIHVNEYFPERNADVVIVLDTLCDAGTAGDSVLDLAARAAASLASYFLRRKDRLGLVEYGGILDWIVPQMGTRQVYRILEKLARVRSMESFAFKDVKAIPERILPPRSLVMVITPLLDQRAERMIGDLAARGFMLIVLYVSPVSVVQREAGDSAVEALAMRLWKWQQEAKVSKLRNLGLTVAEWDGEMPLDAALNQTLWSVTRHVTRGGVPGQAWG